MQQLNKVATHDSHVATLKKPRPRIRATRGRPRTALDAPSIGEARRDVAGAASWLFPSAERRSARCNRSELKTRKTNRLFALRAKNDFFRVFSEGPGKSLQTRGFLVVFLPVSGKPGFLVVFYTFCKFYGFWWFLLPGCKEPV